MVYGLSDTTAIKAPQLSIVLPKTDSLSLNFSKTPDLKNTDYFTYGSKPAILSGKMERYIKKQEAGERHTAPDGRFIVYYGKADKDADALNKEKEPLLTVGHGHSQRGAITVGHRDLKEGDLVSHDQANKLFNDDVNKIQKKLANNEDCTLSRKLTQNQSDAIISYGFNVGVDKFCVSDEKRDIPESMMQCLNKGEFGKAQSKFNIITAGGKVRAGLAKRRIVEMVIFGNGKIAKEAEETFANNKNALSGFKKLKHIYDINKDLKNYGIDDKDRTHVIQKLVY